MQISEFFDHIEQLPMVPEVVRTLIMQLNDPDIDLSTVATDVAKDQVISLKVLKIVNSAYFGLNRKIASIDEAVVMLGMAKLKNIVVASGLTSSVQHPVGLDVKKFWQESIYVAGIAKEIAQLTGKADPDTAFTAGLLSTIGRLLLAMGAPSKLILIQEKEALAESSFEAELAVLGFSSGELGAKLIEKWRFPQVLADGIHAHQQPLEEMQIEALACVLHLARYLASEKLKQSDFDLIMANFPFQVAKQIEVDHKLMECHLDCIFEEVSELDKLLN